MNLNWTFNTLKPRQNGRHFADDIFKCIFLNENVWISIEISLNFVPKGPINNIPALVQIMAWRRPGDKPLSEAMMVNLPTHICVTWPQWVNWYIFSILWRYTCICCIHFVNKVLICYPVFYGIWPSHTLRLITILSNLQCTSKQIDHTPLQHKLYPRPPGEIRKTSKCQTLWKLIDEDSSISHLYSKQIHF